jgi:hypothetical protein
MIESQQRKLMVEPSGFRVPSATVAGRLGVADQADIETQHIGLGHQDFADQRAILAADRPIVRHRHTGGPKFGSCLIDIVNLHHHSHQPASINGLKEVRSAGLKRTISIVNREQLHVELGGVAADEEDLILGGGIHVTHWLS